MQNDVKHYIIAIMIALLVVLAGRGPVEGSASVEILRFSVQPNYLLCTDLHDKVQLSDGKTERYPMWTRKGSVGWRQQGAVLIEGRVVSGGEENLTGILKLHVGTGPRAGVHPPERVDIYGAKGNGQFLHVAEMVPKGKTPFKKDHWIDIPVRLPTRRFALVVRPDGEFLFMDEIAWFPVANVAETKSPEMVGSVEALVADATERHQRHLAAIAMKKEQALNKWPSTIGKPKLLLWFIEDPFGTIEGQVPRDAIGPSALDHGVCHGSRYEKETLCIGAVYTGEKPLKCFARMKGAESLVNRVALGALKRVLAADGRMVFDPIVPLFNSDATTMTPYQPVYFWLTVDMRGLEPGDYSALFKIEDIDGNALSELPVTIKVHPLDYPDGLQPKAVTWGYVSDRPVCNQPKNCVQDMAAHGVNVFVIHPAHIPMPGKRDAAFHEKAALLEKDVALLKGEGRILLLFLHWDQYRPPESEAKNWAVWIRDKMGSMGLKPGQWALYPVDEPRGEKLVLLTCYANWIKEAAPTVAIYANPIYSSQEPSSPEDLTKLQAVIDIWQPSMDLVEKWEGDFFNHRKRSWWIYHNPRAPAKSAPPLHHYRMMAWRAWFYGAEGVGFWSYSDTTGSSAWNDFDGRRPDYAVVYESAAGPVSSRRWEAFREGLEDFQLLQAVSSGNPEAKAILMEKIKTLLENETNAKEHIADIRSYCLSNGGPVAPAKPRNLRMLEEIK